jgi:hypothetical protein
LKNIRDILDQAVEYNDTLTNGLIWLIMMLDFNSGREKDLSILEELADLELSQPKVGSTNEGMIVAIGILSSYNNDFSDETFQRLERMTEKYVGKTKGLYYARNGTQHPNMAIDHHNFMRVKRQNPKDRDLPRLFLQKALKEKDEKFISMLLDLLAIQVSNFDDFLIARVALGSMIDLFPLPAEKRLEDKVIYTLARIRLYQPEEVDNFLQEVDPDNIILPKVLRVEPSEQVWAELFHNTYARVLIRFLQTQVIKDELVWILRQATLHKRLDDYLNLVVKDLMNLLSGEQIFKIEKVR